MSKQIGVLGGEAFVLGFQLAGVRKAWPVNTDDAFEDRVDAILAGREKDVGILIVHAADVEKLSPTKRKRLSDTLDPVVIQLGGAGGDLREKVKRAIGIDVYKE